MYLVDLLGYKVTPGELVMWFSFTTGVYYNLQNIIAGFWGAKSKVRAFQCLIPYIQIYVLIYITSFSQFYEKAALLFFAGLGLFQTYVAGLLNISSTAKVRFPFLYWEPGVYIFLLYLDIMRLVQSEILLAGYCILIFIVLLEYIMFLQSMISSLTKYLGIKLLKVKDVSKTK
jgi:hypothetical protein